jgi:hypothetical protein
MRRVLVIVVVGFFFVGTVFGQTPSPPPGPAPAAKPKVQVKTKTVPQTPEGIECSKQADAKVLHGQERIRFRANCKRRLLKQKS